MKKMNTQFLTPTMVNITKDPSDPLKKPQRNLRNSWRRYEAWLIRIYNSNKARRRNKRNMNR
jgi:hypothetical protein